jgi:hypothetical protein
MPPLPVRFVLVLALALAIVASGCGGKQETFTSENFGTLMSEPGKHDNAKVDVVGQVFLVDRESTNAVWIGIYADPKGMTWETMVKIPKATFFVEENQLVHVVGTVHQDLPKPVSMAGFDIEPVVLADTAAVTPSPS